VAAERMSPYSWLPAIERPYIESPVLLSHIRDKGHSVVDACMTTAERVARLHGPTDRLGFSRAPVTETARIVKSDTSPPSIGIPPGHAPKV
jgi:hypothetical protein